MKASIEWIRWALKLGVEKGEIGVSDVEAESFQKILPVLEAAGKVEWRGDGNLLERFEEATEETRRRAKEFKNDYVWQARMEAVRIARALLESLPDKE